MTDSPAKPEKPGFSPPVFYTSAALLLLVLGLCLAFPTRAGTAFNGLLDGVSTYFGWFYAAMVTCFLVFVVWLMLSPYGRLRLGADDERPRYSRGSWFAMLFSAGMGIGLVFYGVAEPIMHYTHPPTGQGGTLTARAQALPLTMFHWGVHAWGVYVLMGLAIAYAAYRRGLPLAVRSCLHPLFGDRIFGPLGHAVDILAVLGTLFGLATSLGLGAMQVSAGLAHLFGTPHTVNMQILLIVLITAAATASLVAGVDKGIRRLSELNMVLAACLLVFVFALGPTRAILDMLVESTGGYIGAIVERSFKVGAYDEVRKAWAKSWTLFYWGWWISWAPFVGVFVARVSRGRTIREFVAGVLLVPSALTFLWFAVFGGTAIELERRGMPVAQAVNDDVSTAVYVVLEQLPLSAIASGLTALVVAVFFVTSSDSASYVVDMLTSGGHPNPPKWQRIFWASMEGVCAIVLLLAGGKAVLKALQAAVVSIGLPFCVVLVLVAIGLWRSLRQDHALLDKATTRPG